LKYHGCFTTYSKLKEYNIDFDAHPAPKKYFVTIAMLLFTIIFIGSLISSKIQRIFMVEDHHQ
jgi:hypothetical protein